MLRRLFILTMIQLSSKMKLKITNKKRFIANLALRFLGLVVISVVMVFMLFFLNNVLYVPVNVYFVIFVLFVTQLASIISCTTGLMVDLYESKDNSILLSFPAKHDEVFTSKLAVFYINEFLKNLSFLVPLLIAFGAISKLPFTYYFNIFTMILILPLLPVLLAAIISIPIMYIRQFLRVHNTLSMCMLIALGVFVFLGLTGLLDEIPTPIRIVALYNKFITSVTLFMQSSSKYASIYGVIGRLLYGFNVLSNYAIVLGVIIVLIGLVVLISRPLFFRLASHTQEYAVTKKHRGKNKMSRSLFWTFFKKELTISMRSSNEMISNYVLLILFPFIVYVLNYIYIGIDRSTFGTKLVVAFDIMISLLLVTASNTASATAISVEGSEFVLLKTAPSDTKKMAWAKVAFNMIASTLIILLIFVLFQLSLPQFSATDIWLMFVVVIFVNSGHILWSFQIDLLNPKLSDYAATASLSNNENVSKSIIIGLILSILFGGATALLLIENYVTGWIRIIAIAVVFFVARFYLFTNFLKVYFREIEF